MMVVFAVGAFAVALGTDAEATRGEEALELWGTSIVSYAWYWLCLWPMIAVHLRAGQIAEAIDASHQLLAPPQQRFPDDLESLGVPWTSRRLNPEESVPGWRARRADETADPFAEVGRRFELFTDGKLPGCDLCPVNLPRWLRTNDVSLTCSYAASSMRASLACSASLARRISTSPMPWPGRQSGP